MSPWEARGRERPDDMDIEVDGAAGDGSGLSSHRQGRSDRQDLSVYGTLNTAERATAADLTTASPSPSTATVAGTASPLAKSRKVVQALDAILQRHGKDPKENVEMHVGLVRKCVKVVLELCKVEDLLDVVAQSGVVEKVIEVLTVINPSPTARRTVAGHGGAGAGHSLHHGADGDKGRAPAGNLRCERVAHARGNRAAVQWVRPAGADRHGGADLPAGVGRDHQLGAREQRGQEHGPRGGRHRAAGVPLGVGRAQGAAGRGGDAADAGVQERGEQEPHRRRCRRCRSWCTCCGPTTAPYTTRRWA